MDIWLQFLGLFISDGYLHEDDETIQFTFTKSNKIKMLQKVCTDMGISIYSKRITGSKYIQSRAVYYELNSKIKKRTVNKCIPEYCMNLNMRQSQLLISSLIEDDSCICYTSNRTLADQITQVALHAGWSAKINNVNTIRIYINKDQNEPRTKDSSDLIARHERWTNYTGEVMCVEVPTHVFYYRESEYSPPMWTGNSGRSGQKGVASLMMPQSDMPFTASGLVVNLVMNPHSFPKRMTMGHLYEGGLGKICAARGVMCDGTYFRNIDQDQIVSEMRAMGCDYFGRERLFSGMFGTWIDSLIFTCPVYYQRLQKFVAKSVYSIDIGPTDIITRQPLDGKANQGGLRISELQRDVLLAHGCARFFSSKFFTDSDDFEVYYCRCGNVAVVNQQMGIYECHKCKDDADIYAIYSSWSSKQFFMELNAMHVGTQFKLEPFTFYDGY
jgi:hypothetical protein